MKRWQKILISITCVIAIVAVATLVVGPEKIMYRTLYLGLRLSGNPDESAYMYALSIENDFMNSKTQSELERVVACCSTSRQIQPSQSGWGHQYVLQVDERMIQYMIKGNAALDVVYDRPNKVKAIFTSYE